ncbi:MAG: hypothetical protein KatS3mg076_0990 [Candidatus Binatia bacterium]|nr:MAG: hypothetical protein KatS3mg076_0990 [Candidatus Binatia bacterium]
MIKLLQIVPRKGVNLYGLIVRKEIELAQKNRGTFYRAGPKEKDRAKWAHLKYRGWVKIRRSESGVVTAEIRSKGPGGNNSQIFEAFVGWIDRHFGDKVHCMNVQYWQ